MLWYSFFIIIKGKKIATSTTKEIITYIAFEEYNIKI